MPRTHAHPFTKDQIDQLRANRYVKSISSSTIRFTEEFKRYFYQQYKAGMSPRDIFLACGIDPDILGEKRIEGFRYSIVKYAKRDEGFTDKRQSNCRRPAKNDEASMEAEIRKLKHELAYTRQEVEFLKKIHLADMEARRQWESKHQPK